MISVFGVLPHRLTGFVSPNEPPCLFDALGDLHKVRKGHFR